MSDDGPKTEEEVREAYEYENFRLDEDNAFAGGGIVESYYELVSAINKEGENDAAQIAVASVTVGLDTLGMVLDPLGTVFAAGVGWLIEHIGFLREPLDLLMGDPEAIKANAALLQLEAVKFKTYAEENDTAVKAVASWKGEAADKFRKSMGELSEEILSYGTVVSGVSDLTVHMGVAVAALRAVVRDIIATLIGGLVAGALVALAAAWFTFGASIAGFIATAIGMAASTAAKIARVISKLTGIMGRNSSRMAKLSQSMADLAARMEKRAAAARLNPWRPGGSWDLPSDKIDQWKPPPKADGPPAPPPRVNTAPPGGNVAPPPPKADGPPAPPPRSDTAPPGGNVAPPPPKADGPPAPPPRSDTAPSGGPVAPPPKADGPPAPPPRADTMPNMPAPQGVPQSSWAAWTKGGYRNHEQLMRPINKLNQLPQNVVADIARKLFGNKGANDVMHALETAKNVREPKYMITVGGVQIPLGAFGASFSQMANEATKADDNKEDAREAAGAT